jgi:hypothetical protein
VTPRFYDPVATQCGSSLRLTEPNQIAHVASRHLSSVYGGWSRLITDTKRGGEHPV